MIKCSKCARDPNEEVEDEFYLIKNSGSQGSIYNFKNARIVNIKELNDIAKEFDASNVRIEYYGFDNRINFHTWRLIGDNKDYKGFHLCWIYSTSKEYPWLTQATYGDLSI